VALKGKEDRILAATPEGNALTRDEQDRMCRDKRKFKKEKDAINAVVEGKRNGRLLNARVYRCPVCTKWHITSARLPEFRKAG
jgi:hypothetical protein